MIICKDNVHTMCTCKDQDILPPFIKAVQIFELWIFLDCGLERWFWWFNRKSCGWVRRSTIATTTVATTIATIPAGYGDGYSRRLSNRGRMLVNGKRAPIVGRVCMDLTMLDVGHIDDVKVGDEAVLIGRQGEEEISADEIAELLGTINYEVVTALMARVERVYKTADR